MFCSPLGYLSKRVSFFFFFIYRQPSCCTGWRTYIYIIDGRSWANLVSNSKIYFTWIFFFFFSFEIKLWNYYLMQLDFKADWAWAAIVKNSFRDPESAPKNCFCWCAVKKFDSEKKKKKKEKKKTLTAQKEIRGKISFLVGGSSRGSTFDSTTVYVSQISGPGSAGVTPAITNI